MTTDGATAAARKAPAGGPSAVSDDPKSQTSTSPPVPTTLQAAPSSTNNSKRKSRKPPVKDTVTVLIPLHVTADLGVAMRCTRAKRTRKLRELYPELADAAAGHSKRGKDAKQAEVEGDDSGDDDDEEEEGDKAKGKADGGGDDSSSRGDLSPTPSAAGGMRREDYGSVLDYLEAKYVRGVQIGGLEALDDGDGGGKDKTGKNKAAEADDYSGEGSVYSDECSDDGFLDDSMLRHEVVEQVMATGKYGGRTRVEEEARKGRRGGSAGSGGGGSSVDGDAGDANCGEEFNDDAFFVNVGDIELAEGEDPEDLHKPIDWNAIAKESGKGKAKKGRKRKKKADAAAGADTGKKPKKGGKDKGKENGSAKPAKKKKTSKDGTDDATTASGTSKKSTASKASSKKKKDGDADKKKTDKKVKSPKKKAVSPLPTVASTAASSAGGVESSDDDDDDASSSELSPHAIHLANEVAKHKAASDKLHRACIREVKKCTEDDLPRKQPPQKMAKASIPVPADKGPGDSVMFVNPHIPTQKMRVSVPEKWDRAKSGGSITVSVPTLVIRKEKKDNKLPESLREVLTDYSQAHDDYLNTEASYRDACPESMYRTGSFKVNTERQTMFDKIIKAFPKDLQAPIDLAYIRKIVRNYKKTAKYKNKLEKLEKEKAKAKAGGGSPRKSGTSPAKSPEAKRRRLEAKLAEMDGKAPPPMLEICVPGKGGAFPKIDFDEKDFENGRINL